MEDRNFIEEMADKAFVKAIAKSGPRNNRIVELYEEYKRGVQRRKDKEQDGHQQ